MYHQFKRVDGGLAVDFYMELVGATSDTVESVHLFSTTYMYNQDGIRDGDCITSAIDLTSSPLPGLGLGSEQLGTEIFQAGVLQAYEHFFPALYDEDIKALKSGGSSSPEFVEIEKGLKCSEQNYTEPTREQCEMYATMRNDTTFVE